MERMSGAELAARFGAGPNRLGYCGPKGFFSDKNRREGHLKSQLKKFRGSYEYLRLIAKANGRKSFDYEVVEALWLGNKLLEKVSRAALARMIARRFVGPGLLGKKRAAEFAQALPAKVRPHHSFHTFYLVSIRGVLAGTEQELDSCRVSWGKVMGVERGRWKVKYRPIKIDGKHAKFGKPRNAFWKPWPGAGPPARGGWVAGHWGLAACFLNDKQVKRLEKYTKMNMANYAQRP